MSRSDSLKSTLIFVAPANSQEAGDMDGAEDGERSVHFASGGAVYSNPGGAGESMALEDLLDGTVNITVENVDAGGNGDGDDNGILDTVSGILSPGSMVSEQMLQDVLDTRPTLRLGRDVSMRHHKRVGSAHNVRHNRLYSSVPRRRRGSAPGRRSASFSGRSNSLPNHRLRGQGVNQDGPSSITDIEGRDEEGEVEEEEGDEELAGLENVLGGKHNRRSTRRLKERIDMHREYQRTKSVVVRESAWDNFKHVKWPKWKSRAKVLLSWELWKGHMKEVEGHFGTAVVSYFIFLRFLFVMNLLIFALWFGFVVVPGIIQLQLDDTPSTESLLACAYQPLNDSSLICPTDSVNVVGTNATFEDAMYYQLDVTGVYSCNVSESEGVVSFLVQLCEFGGSEATNSSGKYMVAEREGATTVSVTNVDPGEMECMFEGGVVVDRRMLRLCPGGIAPRVLWYEYIIDFVLGQGVFNDTILFYGRYSNTTVVEGTYSIPLAYLVVTGVIYTISVVLLVYKLGSAYNESYTQVGARSKINFCNKVFTAWDFNITNSNTAKLKRIHIRTDFEEELADYDRRNLQRSWHDVAKVVAIRCFTNLFTVVVLAGGSAAIFYAAEFGLQNPSSTFEGLVLPVVITTLNIALPFIFSFLAKIERFKTQSGEIKMTLLRTIIVRLSSLIVLIITLFILISCTQQVQEDVDANTCEFTFNIDINTTTSAASADCPVCWETFVGQEFYKLGLTNFAVSSASTIAVETFRNIVSRVKYFGLGAKIGKGNFNIPKSILDLIYTQALLWLGFFFSPLLPAVIMLTSVVLFYVKKYSLIYNLTPDKRGTFRAARTNFLFILLMLISLFLILLPISYVIASFNPSSTCGPFRGNQFIFTVVTELIDGFNCAAQQALDFFGSVGFVIPLLVFLLLVIYGQFVVLRARKDKFRLIKKQLVLEGANVTHIVGKLDGVLRRVADQRAAAERGELSSQGSHVNLQQRILNIRNSLTDSHIEGDSAHSSPRAHAHARGSQ